jgi:hypothetical protein
MSCPGYAALCFSANDENESHDAISSVSRRICWVIVFYTTVTYLRSSSFYCEGRWLFRSVPCRSLTCQKQQIIWNLYFVYWVTTSKIGLCHGYCCDSLIALIRILWEHWAQKWQVSFFFYTITNSEHRWLIIFELDWLSRSGSGTCWADPCLILRNLLLG